jgi:hypothetical protein
LNWKRCTAAEAESMAVEALDSAVADDWSAVARWLARVEKFARQAEVRAATGAKAAAAGQ